jgi:anti-sigma B factor antagonist
MSSLQIQTTPLKRVDLVTVSGRVDHNTAPQLEEALKAITEADRYRIVVDLHGVTFMSSAGLKVLIGTLKNCRRFNRGDVRLAGLAPQLRHVFELAGLHTIFQIYDDRALAVGSF